MSTQTPARGELAEPRAGHQEEWRAVVGYEGHYEVSDQGRIRTLSVREYGRVLNGKADAKGYLCISLWREGRATHRRAHRLVLEAFVGLRPEGLVARHLDGNPVNNSLSNLAWGTRAENEADKLRHGTSRTLLSHCRNGHEYTPSNTRVALERGREVRRCITCRRATRRD